MKIRYYLYALLFVLDVFFIAAWSSSAAAAEINQPGKFEIWPIHDPWQDMTQPAPKSMPFIIPRFDNGITKIHTPIAPLAAAPKVDAEGIYYAVLNCYPERSKFNLQIDLESRYSTRRIYDASQNTIGRHYIALVARMPLYSATDMSRERDREYLRRTTTAQTVGLLIAALASRNHAYRELGLYSALEARSQIRVAQGVADSAEQVGHLGRVAAAQQSLIVSESQLVQYRLTLISQCGEGESSALNYYIQAMIERGNDP